MAEAIEFFFKVALILGLPLGAIPFITLVERRGAAFIQRRLGPNRVGPFGILQAFADVVKFLFKEEVVPTHTRKFFFVMAPILTLFFAIIPLAGIPIMEPFVFADKKFFPEVFHTEMGLFYVFAATTLGGYGVLLAGWASNNKYSMLGALRAAAQMVSYELAMSIVVVTIFFFYGTHDLHKMVTLQDGYYFGVIPKWGVFVQPIAAIIFLVAVFAECNRTPFDLAEGESEIVAGYHVEYSSLKFGMFYMAEYVHMIVLSALYAILFLGGYQVLPGLHYLAEAVPSLLWTLQVISIVTKVACMIWFFIWVRWSIPRFRYDQLMDLGWKRLLPLGFFNFLITVCYIYFKGV